MVSSQQNTYSQESEHNKRKSDQSQQCGSFTPPPKRQALVNHSRVCEPANKTPGFLGVPAPVEAPRAAGPQCAGNDAKGQQKKSQEKAPAVDSVEGLQRRQKPVESPYPFGLYEAFLENVHEAAYGD